MQNLKKKIIIYKLIVFFTFLFFCSFNISELKAANYYWRATAVNNLYTNVGNWETSPGSTISPAVAPSANDDVYFPITSNFVNINFNGGFCFNFNLTAASVFTFSGTGNISGDLNANGNVRFTGILNLVGSSIKNINLDPNPLTSTQFFGSVNCNQGSIILKHNFIASGSLAINHSPTTTAFISNGYDIRCRALNIGTTFPIASTFIDINLANSYVECSGNLSFANYFVTKNYTATRFVIMGSQLYIIGNASSTPISCQSIKYEGNKNNFYHVGTHVFNVDSLIINAINVIEGDQNANCTWNVNHLVFEKPTTINYINANLLYNLNQIIAPPICDGQVTFFGPCRINTLSPITENKIAFNGVIFSGIGYSSSISNNLGNNSGTGISWAAAIAGQTFHWVGGGGNWNDPTKWTLLGSGAAAQSALGCLPTARDSVVFDANSFTAVGQTVNTTLATALCKSISVTDPNLEGRFNGTVNIYGNADFSGANAVNSIILLGAGNHTLNSGNSLVYSANIIFRGEGTYTLSSRMFTAGVWEHYSGRFISDGQLINALSWVSTRLHVSYIARNINIENSTIDLNDSGGSITGWRVLNFSNTQLTALLTNNSTIRINANVNDALFSSNGAPVLANPSFNDLRFTANAGTAVLSTPSNYIFNNVYFNSNASNSGSTYTVDTLHLTAGKIYSFTSNVTYNINHINTISNICDELAVVSSSAAIQARFFKAALPFSANNLMISNVNANGVQLSVSEGVDAGNLTNVTITVASVRELYWVGNSGNWSDGGHWSIGLSGGNPALTNPGGCIPRPIDNVYFDANSFTVNGRTVTLNIDGNCKNMTWDLNATGFAPTFTGLNSINLNIYGSLELNNGMIHSHKGTTFFRGTDTLALTQTIKTDNVLFQSLLNFIGGGRYDFISQHLQSGGTNEAGLIRTSGYIVTNGHTLRLSIMNLGTPVIDMSNSYISIYGAFGGGACYYARNHSPKFNAQGSTIHTVGPGFVALRYDGMYDTVKYHNVILNNNGYIQGTFSPTVPVQFNKIEFRTATSNMDGLITIISDTLIYRQSSVNVIGSGKKVIVNETLIANGTPCIPIQINSSTSGSPATLGSNACNFDIQFGSLRDLNANISTGCTAADYRVVGSNAGGSSNWTFTNIADLTQLGPDTTIYCTNSPLEIKTTGFGIASSYVWSNGATTASLNVSTSGTHVVTVTYAAGCIAKDTLSVTYIDSSTAPSIALVPGVICPNSNVTLNASGGTIGSGSQIKWYSGPNGSGSLLGIGNSIVIAPNSNMTVYTRREGTCNLTVDDSTTVNTKYYVYAADGATSNTYCTDNSGWHHFYIGDEIIYSVLGDLSAVPAGFPIATIYDNGAYYQSNSGPNNSGFCVNGLFPGEERFEMERSWDLNLGAGTPIGSYQVRFYYEPAERTAIENAAIAWMSSYPACGYTYKYATPLGFYWFKNSGAPYSAPQWDNTHYSANIGTTFNSVNYAQWAAVPGFSGGSGAVILVPTALLSVDWQHFTGFTFGKINKLEWATGSEENTAKFEVQRSKDGANFETIGIVTAAGNSQETNTYHFDDNNPIVGQNYYRLRLINSDQSSELSDLVVLNIEADGKGYNFYPNPAKDELFYQFSTERAEDIQIELLNVLGAVISTKVITSNTGLNAISTDMSNLEPGNYLIRVKHVETGVSHSSKIVKD
jgi:hypothetical protein